MKRSFYILVIWFVGAIFNACEPADKIVEPKDEGLLQEPFEDLDSSNWMDGNSLPDYLVTQLWSYQNIQLGNYGIEFMGRTVTGAEESQTTTFSYKISAAAKASQSDGFIMEIPECAGTPIDWFPAAVSVVNGKFIKWNKALASNEIQEFSVTFDGDVPLGVVNASTSVENKTEMSSVLGPCTGIRTITGSLFVDANEDGIKQNSESGVGEIPVHLLTPDNGTIATIPTADDGSYYFIVINGDYKISARGNLLEEGYFIAPGSNDVGYSDIEFTYINLPGLTTNVSEQNFPYNINRPKIINDLENDILVTDTQPKEFWVRQFTAYRQEGAVYSEKELRDFLIEIENTLLMEPFQFGEDKEGAALDILLRDSTTEYEEFLKQLLIAELNVLSGRGVLQSSFRLNKQFNSALLIYSEAVACRENGNCAEDNSSSSKTAIKAINRTDTVMLIAFNGTGGI